MRALSIASAILLTTTSLASASGDDGGAGCRTRQMAGKWSSTFDYVKADGSVSNLSCTMVIGRDGAITDASCIADTVTSTPFVVTGSFGVDVNCSVIGTLSDEAATMSLNVFGEVTQQGDIFHGMVYMTDGWFKPLTSIRTAKYRANQHVDDESDHGPGHHSHP